MFIQEIIYPKYESTGTHWIALNVSGNTQYISIALELNIL